MPRIIKNRQIIDDNTQHLGSDDALPFSPCTVPLQRWLEQYEQLQRHPTSVGVWVRGDDDLEQLAPYIQQLQLIAVEFPRFTDGRSYSQARLLRERYGYQGELRAVGNVLRDQLLFMERCGIDAFELSDPDKLEDSLKSFSEIKVYYQPATATPAILRRLRQRRAQAV